MLLAAALVLGAAAASRRDASHCSCGYRDSTTNLTFTESIIVYFNETKTVDPAVFKTLDYSNNNQKGWNVIFRQGASPENVNIDHTEPSVQHNSTNSSDTSLGLYLDGARFDHLSEGAELGTIRQDILYGTFRASMRSAQPWIGGSAMSMYLQYNESNSLEVDL